MSSFSVFVQDPELDLAVDFYETFGADGHIRVELPVRRHGDMLGLLRGIARTDGLILLVNHGNPNGLVLPLTGRRGSGRADSDALALLLKLYVLRKRRARLAQDGGDLDSWFDLANFVTASESGRRPLETLLNPPPGDTAEVTRLRQQFREQQAALAGRPADLAQARDQMRERLRQAMRNYEDAQRSRMRLRPDEVDALIEAMTAVQRLRPSRVVVRGCNLGQDEMSMTALAYFLGARILDAPTVYTVYGPLRIAVGGRAPRQLRGSHRVCAQEDVRRSGGCHWRLRVEPSGITDRIDIRIRYTGGISYTALGHAPDWDTVRRWVTQSFGAPAGGLRRLQERPNLARVPIHFLLTAPPAFPLDARWASFNVRVLGWSAGF